MIVKYALVAGAMATLLAGSANAETIYDTLHGTVGQLSATAMKPAAGPLAVQFTAPTKMTITDIQLLMNANAPTDGGSVLVWLVDDVGGLPEGGANFASFGLHIGTILDSDLTLAGGTGLGQSAGIEDLPLSLTVEAGTYWLGLTQTTGSAKLVFDNLYNPVDGVNAIGTAGMKDMTQTTQFGTYHTDHQFVAVGSSAFTGWRAFEVQIDGVPDGARGDVAADVPEPASLGLLGAGVAALGFLGRRRRRRS